jgi:hypothetical protein
MCIARDLGASGRFPSSSVQSHVPGTHQNQKVRRLPCVVRIHHSTTFFLSLSSPPPKRQTLGRGWEGPPTQVQHDHTMPRRNTTKQSHCQTAICICMQHVMCESERACLQHEIAFCLQKIVCANVWPSLLPTREQRTKPKDHQKMRTLARLTMMTRPFASHTWTAVCVVLLHRAWRSHEQSI